MWYKLKFLIALIAVSLLGLVNPSHAASLDGATPSAIQAHK